MGEEFVPQKCTLCNHERRQEIERAFLCGDSHRAIAARSLLSRAAQLLGMLSTSLPLWPMRENYRKLRMGTAFWHNCAS